ncbi:DMT family transporter [Jiella marina]|uniref:DMT family transporter n=1 Tax=Jiella sp. LLJ827 TaxID=2917712 RepID=UPI0021014126|nr:DMT family transporter [Jiella sp. LLJ827]MCQ0987703.1 DMT family transporter [Jiella sp. LLJ827]
MPPLSSLLTGILLTLTAGTVFAVQDSLGKYLTGLMPVLQVIWGRYMFQTLLTGGVLLARQGPGFLKTAHPVLQGLRGAALLVTTGLMYSAFSQVPLADATAVLFFTPILITVFSVLFLKERIGIHRIGAVIGGFIGMLVILQPGFSAIDPALFLAVAAAFTNVGYLMLTRRLSGRDDSAATMFNTSAPGTIVLTLIVIPIWETPQPVPFALMVTIGFVGAFGHFLLIRGFSHAPASLLSPFLYIQVLAASVLSVVVFGDPLRPSTALGAAILVFCGLYIWWRENHGPRAVA